MVSLYDEAVLAKLVSWTDKTNIHVYSNNANSDVFAMIGDETNDSPVQLPLIALRRIGGYELINPNSDSQTRNGYVLTQNEAITVQLNAIPIKVVYQIDIYSRYKKESDLYCRDLIFNIVNHPTCQVTIPYNDLNIQHNFNLHLNPQIADNSSVPEDNIGGKFSRMTLTVEITDAYLWSVPVRRTFTIDSGVVEPNGNKDEDEPLPI